MLADERLSVPVDVRLYLSKKWAEDPERCDKAGIPEDERTFRTRDELALEIVGHARQNGLRFGWVGADGGYGKGPEFCLVLDRMGERFVVDLHTNFRVYLDVPQPYIPEKKGRGRKFTRYRIDAESLEVKDVIDRLKLKDQPILTLRNTPAAVRSRCEFCAFLSIYGTRSPARCIAIPWLPPGLLVGIPRPRYRFPICPTRPILKL